MTCHSQVWRDAPVLAPIRKSFVTGQPVRWQRVNQTPDFVFFDHSIHVRRGVACTTCHGEVAEMPLTWKESTLYMEWCLECHRAPEEFIGPPEAVFASTTTPETPHAETGIAWENKRGTLLTNCSICHF